MKWSFHCLCTITEYCQRKVIFLKMAKYSTYEIHVFHISNKCVTVKYILGTSEF